VNAITCFSYAIIMLTIQSASFPHLSRYSHRSDAPRH
jgi:hypothetical protein